MDVCKKLELNPLRFDRDIRVLSKKKYFQNFSFFPAENEKRCKSAVFQDFSKKNFSIWSVITPLFYMWFNIDARGHKKAQKRQNIAVGPEDPPPGNYQDPKPRVTKG